MRIFTLLMATFILSLALKPGMDLLSLQGDEILECCAGECCPASENSNENKTEKEDCSGKSCNPFQVCGCCTFVCLANHFNLLHKTFESEKQVFSLQKTFPTLYTSDFWQPPKIG